MFHWSLHEQENESAITYTVTSESSQMPYRVKVLASECPQGKKCIPQCTQGKCLYLCRHILQCTCYDYSHGHLCKHVHKVQGIHQTVIEDDESNTGKMTLYSMFHVSCKKSPFPERDEEPTTELMCTPAKSLPNVTGIIRVIFKETILTFMQ